jgi:molybdopterin synthase catalytic subunit
MVETLISGDPLPSIVGDDGRNQDGAELIFHGRVRDHEEGRAIVALEYERYEGMAERELKLLAEETARRFSVHDLFCIHRVGRVAVGEASIRVVIWSAHRAEGLEAMAWFISELKRRVPIWKWALTPAGERFPSTCGHAH